MKLSSLTKRPCQGLLSFVNREKKRVNLPVVVAACGEGWALGRLLVGIGMTINLPYAYLICNALQCHLI